MRDAVIVVVVLVIVAAVLLVFAYNSMVRARNMVDQAWSGINVQLKRRHDLVPNLVSSVSAYVSHERGIMSEVTRAHEGAREGGGGPAAVAPAERALGAALGRLIGLSEAYPQLRASENFLALQAQLADTEDQIAAARRIYNGNVQAYNSRIQSFPAVLLAGPAGFRAREYFLLDDAEERAPVRVSFSPPG